MLSLQVGQFLKVGSHDGVPPSVVRLNCVAYRRTLCKTTKILAQVNLLSADTVIGFEFIKKWIKIMKILAVMFLAMVVMIGCQVEEGDEASEIKSSEEEETCENEDGEYDYRDVKFRGEKFYLRLPEKICQKASVKNSDVKSVEICPTDETEPNALTLTAAGPISLPITINEVTYEEGDDVYAKVYSNKKDGRRYQFICYRYKRDDREFLQLLRITIVLPDGTGGPTRQRSETDPRDIRNQCWSASCREGSGKAE